MIASIFTSTVLDLLTDVHSLIWDSAIVIINSMSIYSTSVVVDYQIAFNLTHGNTISVLNDITVRMNSSCDDAEFLNYLNQHAKYIDTRSSNRVDASKSSDCFSTAVSTEMTFLPVVKQFKPIQSIEEVLYDSQRKEFVGYNITLRVEQVRNLKYHRL
jgi:hypothetical protein